MTDYDRHLMPTIERRPLEVVGADCSIVHVREPGYEADVRHMLDTWCDDGVMSMGYSSTEVTAAVRSFLRTEQPHQLPDMWPHPIRWQCAERMCEETRMDRVFFANSGAEANEAMIKLARRYRTCVAGRTERNVILSVAGNFFGRTLATLAAGDPRVSPHHYEGMGPIPTGFGVIEYEDGDWRQVVTDSIVHEPRQVLWDRVAGVMLTPVLGNHTVHTYPHEFWERLDKLRQEEGVLLLYDEIQTGAGRCGPYAAWRHSSIGLRPDAMTLGKGIAMGFPMSAMLARGELATAFTPGTHFCTFGGSPFCCHVAIRMMSWLAANRDTIETMGRHVRSRFEHMSWVESVDGLGLMNAFTPRYGDWTSADLVREAQREGVLMAAHRPRGPVRFTMPLNAHYRQIELAIDALDRAGRRLSGV